MCIAICDAPAELGYDQEIRYCSNADRALRRTVFFHRRENAFFTFSRLIFRAPWTQNSCVIQSIPSKISRAPPSRLLFGNASEKEERASVSSRVSRPARRRPHPAFRHVTRPAVRLEKDPTAKSASRHAEHDSSRNVIGFISETHLNLTCAYFSRTALSVDFCAPPWHRRSASTHSASSPLSSAV